MPIFHIRPDHDRPKGWKILELAGIPFYVEPSFLLFIGLIMLVELQQSQMAPNAATNPIAGAGLLGFIIFFSLLAHEAGHALVARLFGGHEISVSLVMMGGVTRHPPTTRGRSLLITLAGPLVTIALAAAAYGFANLNAPWMQREVSQYIVKMVFFLNSLWAIFNLLPIFPMDGGKAVLFVLSFMMREQRALLATAFLSLAVCAAIAFYFVAGRRSPRGDFLILFYLLITFITQNVQIIRDQWPRR